MSASELYSSHHLSITVLITFHFDCVSNLESMVEVSNEFYWDNLFVKVEDKLFCVPRREFVQSSEVFADMFLLPSGPATPSEGQDGDHPIVLEGYKKDDFTSLLKVMYPTASSLISGTNLELDLKKEEWVSVLKLSTMWNMTKIRQYAIYWLSANATLSPIEKILLARAHRVAAWLDEGVASLVTCDPIPTLEDLATLGWENAARFLWMRSNIPQNSRNTLRFKRDAIKCTTCLSSLINDSYGCGHITSGDAELTIFGSVARISGTSDFWATLKNMRCAICSGTPFDCRSISCNSCSATTQCAHDVKVSTLNKLIKDMFGEEMKDYEPSPPDSS